MKPLLVTSGEPSGIGPDICLALAGQGLPLVVVADKSVLSQRADLLKLKVDLIEYHGQPLISRPHCLYFLPISCAVPVTAGQLDARNAEYVLNMLRLAADKCLLGEFSALITAPVHKAVINQAKIAFTGHTEFFAEYYAAETVVMMLACDVMKVALVTTHLPLQAVPKAITSELIVKVAKQLNQSLKEDFGLNKPRILVSGLNPHAGEDGYLGREEIDIINPALDSLKHEGLDVTGPYPADTLFSAKNLSRSDVFLTMYHDQGLPVLKYAGFGNAVNITLGLPIIRTSVDHGTALELAGSGMAESSSLLSAINMALSMVKSRETINANP